MVDISGPTSGTFGRLITPVEGDKGLVGPCGSGQLDIEFQARLVRSSSTTGAVVGVSERGEAADGMAWVLSTDVEVQKC